MLVSWPRVLQFVSQLILHSSVYLYFQGPPFLYATFTVNCSLHSTLYVVLVLSPVFLLLCQAQHHVHVPRAPGWLPAHVAMESRTGPMVPPQKIVPCSRLPLSPTKQLSGGQAEPARKLPPARLLGRARPAWRCRQPLQWGSSWQQRKQTILQKMVWQLSWLLLTLWDKKQTLSAKIL